MVVYLRAYRGPDAQEKLRRDGKYETGNYGVDLSASSVGQAVADLAGAGATTVVLVHAGDETFSRVTTSTRLRTSCAA